ncbi:hypothetical protein G9A89_009079 [Geosiphon pyriformis]|nr:hypothetical protein G9A89_009079 [Geosiphon pyriformis]
MSSSVDSSSPTVINNEILVEAVIETLSDLNLGVSASQQITDNNDSTLLLPQFKDITSFLDVVTQGTFRNISRVIKAIEFQIGQLVHLESFGLYDAMSSIEIMDPKMDSGMILDSDLTKEPFVLNTRLNPKQVLGIIDRLFICEMTWHSGHSLSQTLFTCMYLHHILELKADLFSDSPIIGVDHDSSELPIEFVILVLKSYILGTAKCSYFVLEEMTKGNVYEEEDFATNKFGLNLHEDYPESHVVNLLDDAIVWLDKVGRTWISQHDFENCDALIQALQCRLRLRKSFLLALFHLSQPRCQHYASAQKELITTLQILTGTKSEPGIKDTINLGLEVEGAFDPLINRKLVSQTPPRPIRLLSMQESLDQMLNLLQNTHSICGIIDYKSVDILINFFYYHAARQPSPCAFSRSLLQSTFCTENRILGKFTIYQILKDSVTELSNPPYVYFSTRTEIEKPQNGAAVDDRAQISRLVHTFMESSSKPLTDFYRILCHNRSRQRRNMCKVLTDWDLLQEEAEQIDSELHHLIKEEPIITEDGPSHSYYLSSWVYHRKLVLSQEILFLGFELGLYGNHEFVMIYWYLDYLLGVHFQHLERMALHINSKTSSTTKELKKSKKQKALRATPPSAPSVSLLTSKKIMMTARQEICRGIYRTITALQKTGHILVPQLEYDDESIRFWHRFLMYRNLGSPTMLTFSEFKENTKFQNLTAIDLLAASKKNYESAKSAIENLLKMKLIDSRMDLCESEFQNDLKAMFRVCIANIVGVQKMLEDTEILLFSKDVAIKMKDKQKKRPKYQPKPESSSPPKNENSTPEHTRNKNINYVTFDIQE